MRKREGHSFQALIERGRRKLKKEIRRTFRPFLNLHRLATQPCRELGCGVKHFDTKEEKREKVVDIIRIVLLIVITIQVIIWAVSSESWLLTVWLSVCCLFGVWFIPIIAHSTNWKAHESELNKKRASLQGVNTTGEILTYIFCSDIERCRQDILGEKCSLTQSKTTLEKCLQNGVVDQRELVESAGYRKPALTGVRVDLVTKYDDVPTVYVRYLAFRQEAENTFAKLTKQAEVLGESVDNLERYRRGEHVSLEISDLEKEIQERVELFYLSLTTLAQKAKDINVCSVRAAVQHGSSQRNAPSGHPYSELVEVKPEEMKSKRVG